MENWDEIRTAFQVARLGTVSGAAEVLGVHHATVIRHIDALEKRLGAKLFQRHARGYTPTESGHDLLAVAQTTEEQFAHLVSRIKGHGETVSGELVVTSIGGISDLLTPVITSFQGKWPDVRVRFLTDMRVFRLDYGEAHVAIRAGSGPEEPDNVVQPLAKLRSGLFAARSYVEKFGKPDSEADFAGHRFVCTDHDVTRAPFHRWLRATVQPEQITYAATEPAALENAVRQGAGIGFMASFRAAEDPNLVEVLPPRVEWDSALRIVTHVDLHRTRKVQAFLNHLKDAAKEWKFCA
jgi:DNA-binding transcriptional LysR family regulator